MNPPNLTTPDRHPTDPEVTATPTPAPVAGSPELAVNEGGAGFDPAPPVDSPDPMGDLETGSPFDTQFQQEGQMVAGPGSRLAAHVAETLTRGGARAGKTLDDLAPTSFLNDVSFELEHGTGNPLKGVDFNYEKIESSDDVKQLIDAVAQEYEASASFNKRGVQTWEELRTEAVDVYGDNALKDMLGRQPGQLLNGSQLKAGMDLYVKVAEDTVALTRQLSGAQATPEMAVKVQQNLALMGALHSQVKGTQTEIARAMNSMKIVRSSEAYANAQIEEIVSSLGGMKVLQAKAQALTNAHAIGGTGMMGATGRKMLKATTMDMIQEVYVASLLSGFRTMFGTNNVGNIILQAVNTYERGMAAGTRSMIKFVKPDSANGVTWGEFDRYIMGQLQGSQIGWRIALDSLVSGTSARAVKMGIEGPAHQAKFTAENVAKLPLVKGANRAAMAAAGAVDARLPGKDMLSPAMIKAGGIMGATTDFLGENYFRLPFRVLQAEDLLYQSMSYTAELSASAYRRANDEMSQQGVAAVMKRYDEIIDKPDELAPDIHIRAIREAQEATLAQPPGELGATILKGLRNPYLRPVTGFVVPFFRVVNNILRWTGDRQPLKYFNPEHMAKLRDPATRDLEVAKMTTGAMLLATGTLMVTESPGGASVTAEGTVGGYARTKGARLMNRRGYTLTVPWSMIDPQNKWKGILHEGKDTAYDLRKLDPPTTMFLMAAQTAELMKYAETDDEREEVAALAILSFKDVLMDASWFSNFAEFVNVATNDGSPSSTMNKASKYIAGIGSGFAPSWAAMIRHETDNVRRDTRPDNPFDTWAGRTLNQMYNKMCNRWPGCSEDLPPLVNLFGEDIVLEGALGPDMISPIFTSYPKVQQADLADAGLPEHIVRANTFRNLRVGHNMTKDELRRFIRGAGVYGEMERMHLPVDKRDRVWKGVPLTPAQHNYITKIEGPTIMRRLEDLITDEVYIDAPEGDDVDGNKQDMIKAEVSAIRRATDQRIANDPEWADVRDGWMLREYVQTHGRRPYSGSVVGVDEETGLETRGSDLLPPNEEGGDVKTPDAAVKDLLDGRYSE